MKAMPRLPLNSLRVFEAVGRLGSMAKAAEALNVQPSAVSMQMRKLAEYVGLPLVARAGRRVELTREGELLLQSVLSGLRQIEAAIAALRRASRERPFVLSTTPGVLHLWLMPRLGAFESAHPEFHMRIVSSRELVDPSRGEIDAALRLGRGRWPGVRARKLMDDWLVPACAPALAKKVGHLRRGELPRGVTLLASTLDPWTIWSPDGAPPESPAIQVDDAISVVRAAEHGRGVALVRTAIIEQSLAEGRLVMVGEAIPYRFSYYYVTPRAGVRDERAEAFYRWIKAQAEATARPTSGTARSSR
jgi:LysR family transcriptional regulator, glycine cleavage system transcriptional activator